MKFLRLLLAGRAKIGLTFASAMRGFSKVDPDVTMIGEIRDQETARIAIQASLTGRLVLSTLHTNSACESVTCLLYVGMDALNFADSPVGIGAQRLVRTLRRQCAEKGHLAPLRIKKPVGCNACDAKGLPAQACYYRNPEKFTCNAPSERTQRETGMNP